MRKDPPEREREWEKRRREGTKNNWKETWAKGSTTLEFLACGKVLRV